MPLLRHLEIGVMFWAGGDPDESIRTVKSIGAKCGQLGIPGDLNLTPELAGAWKAALAAEEFPLVTIFAAYAGEDYADIPTVQRTVGFIPPETRAAREVRTRDVIHFGAALGITSFACHIGCVPEDRNDPDYIAVREMVRRICEYAATYGMNFALETGQEPAPVLYEFFDDVARTNLKINFDPANMILYGCGEPIEAFQILARHVVSLHAKDGDWPAKGVPGALGVERPLGQGSVNIPKFIAAVKATGYEGTLNVERESSDTVQRLKDISAAIQLLQSLR
jgi:L-ribulose-5-phosphate 3-epimerase